MAYFPSDLIIRSIRHAATVRGFEVVVINVYQPNGFGSQGGQYSTFAGVVRWNRKGTHRKLENLNISRKDWTDLIRADYDNYNI